MRTGPRCRGGAWQEPFSSSLSSVTSNAGEAAGKCALRHRRDELHREEIDARLRFGRGEVLVGAVAALACAGDGAELAVLHQRAGIAAGETPSAGPFYH